MALANVNVGTGPSAGNGDSLRSAFITINENFTELNANVEAISHPVTSVAGRTGAVVLTKNDIIGLRDGDADSSPNASTVSSWITSNVNAIIGSAPDALNTLVEIAAAIDDDANIATTLTSTITTANVNMKGYVDGQVTTINSTITTANTNVVGYTDDAISTANVNLKGYVDNEVTEITNGTQTFGNLIPSANVTYNLGSESARWNELHLGANTLYLGGTTLSTADIANWNTAYGWGDHSTEGYLTSYTVTSSDVTQHQANITITESQISDLSHSNYANADVAAYLTTNSYTTETYVDTANVNVVGYVDNAVSTANVNLKGYADATFLTSFTETNDLTTAVVWANIPDGHVPSSAVTQHQANLTITESQISDLGTYATTTDVTTANVNLKGYVDNEITGLSLGNISTVDLNGNVSTVLAGDGTFIAAGSGGSGISNVVEDTTPQLGGNLDLNGNYITGTGNIAITGNIIGDNRVTGSLTVDDSIAVENNVTLNGGVIQIEGQTGNITATNIKATDYEYANGTSIIDTINSTIDADISTANVNVVGYVDNAVSTANVNVVGYVDNAVSTANVNVVGYVDAANVNVVGYVDNAVTTANVNLKGYVDNEISGLSLGNISTINLDGNVSNVLAGDGTFITAGTGSLTAVVEDTTPQLGGDLDLNSSDITGTGNINITGTLTTSSTATFNGDAIFETGVEEKFATLTSSTGTVTHNCDNGHIFYHTTPSGNITANFTNLGLTAEYATTVTCIVNQGATAYIVNGVQIGGSAQTINWQGGVEPTGTDNGIDSFSFTILNDGGTYVVLGQMVDFT